MNIRLLVNFVLFQLGWFACVLSASAGASWLGTIIALGICAYHLYTTVDFDKEFQLILVVLLIGFSWDSFLVQQGIFQFNSGMFYSSMAPHWIFAMWALFATTLNVSMRWLKGRYLVATALGAIAGPMAYLAGEKLGAVVIAPGTETLVTIAAGWAFILPAVVWMSTRFDGFRSDSSRTHDEREVLDV